MKQKSESSCGQPAKFAKYGTGTPTFALGRKRSDYKPKYSYVHYGFLVVEWICAHGLPLSLIEDMKGKIVGPEAEAGPILIQWKKKCVKEDPTIYSCQMTDESADNKRVKIEGRNLSTWIPHALMTELMMECEVRFVIFVAVFRLKHVRVPFRCQRSVAICRCRCQKTPTLPRIRWRLFWSFFSARTRSRGPLQS
jgi:hypothetical protein